jgi:hypothetical protein
MPSTPRHKRLSRKGRLQAAKHWIPQYNGKNLIKGYKNHFGINYLCAVKELEMLGYEIDPEYKKKLKQSEEAKRKAAERRKMQTEEEEFKRKYPFSDETFYFIAGYTSEGVPYGITWDEYERENSRVKRKE